MNVHSQLNYETLEMLIDGQMTQGSCGKTIEVLDPSNGMVIGQVPQASIQDLDRALTAAEKGFDIWRKMSPFDRSAIIRRAADLLRTRHEAISITLTLEEGKPLAEAKMEVLAAADILDWYAEEGRRAYGRVVASRMPNVRQLVLREPIGPCAGFTPWNFPAGQPAHKIGAALAAGCSLVLKASEETPGTAVSIARAFVDADLPPGVLGLVFGDPGTVSSHLISSPTIRKISFTGSTPVGRHLAALAAQTLTKATMELGGHAPVIICENTDPIRAAEVLVAGKFRNAAQICASPTRFFVHESHYDKFVEHFTKCTRGIKVANGLHSDTKMGPLANARRVQAMEAFVADAVERGAEVLTGGKRIGTSGNFFEPTVLTGVAAEARVMHEEPFGPIVPILPFKSLDDALERANSTAFGLAAFAFTNSNSEINLIADAFQAGLIGINHLGVASPETPFGGIKDSGYGQEGGCEGLEAFMSSKFVSTLSI